MKILVSAYYEFIKNLRDIKMFALLVVAPLIMIPILGNSIQGYFSGDIDKKIAVGYICQDNGIVGQEFDSFLGNGEISKRLDLKKYSNLAEGQEGLKDNKVEALIYLPEGLSQSVSSDLRETIQIYGDKNVELISSIVKGFTASYNAVKAAALIGGNPTAEFKTDSSIERIVYTEDGTNPRAIDYYGVLTLLQMMIIGAIFGVFITTKDYGTDIHIRIHSLPVKKGTLIFGRIIGSGAYVFLGALITMISTKFLYGVNWNGNPVIILGTILVFSFTAVGLGVLIGSLVSGFSTALMIVLLLMIFFGTFSGAISPASVNDTVKNFIPNYHAKVLLFGTIYGYSRQVMVEAAIWLAGIMIVVYGAAWIAVRRDRYDNI
ncbi:MAG: ABC transporter permease [Bacillota bacterium]|nr:ABC transporter permease [Bacillota bacterium]